MVLRLLLLIQCQVRVCFTFIMSLDNFGCSLHSSNDINKVNNLIRTPISFTSEDDVNCENRKLCNVKKPELSLDGTNREYLHDEINDNNEYIDIQINTDKKYADEQMKSIKHDFKIAFNNHSKASRNAYENKLQKLFGGLEKKLSETDGNFRHKMTLKQNSAPI